MILPKIYPEDLVRLKDNPEFLGIVRYTGLISESGDESDIDSDTSSTSSVCESEISLEPNQVLVNWSIPCVEKNKQPNFNSIVQQDELEVVDRVFLLEDGVSHSSGMKIGEVINVNMMVKLQNITSGELLDFNVYPNGQISEYYDIEEDQLAFHGNDLKLVDSITYKYHLEDMRNGRIKEKSSNSLFYEMKDSMGLYEEDDRLYPSQIIKLDGSGKQFKVLSGEIKYIKLSSNDTDDRLEKVAPSNAQFLDHYKAFRTQRGDVVKLKGQKEPFALVSTATTVDIRWQDGMISKNIPTRECQRIHQIDDDDVFAGDYVKVENSFAVIQSVNQDKKLATAKFLEEQVIKDVPLISIESELGFSIEVEGYVLLDGQNKDSLAQICSKNIDGTLSLIDLFGNNVVRNPQGLIGVEVHDSEIVIYPFDLYFKAPFEDSKQHFQDLASQFHACSLNSKAFDSQVSQFEISDNLPSNHAFIRSKYSENLPKSRIRKEFQLLNDLPYNIMARSFDSRVDLLRCLVFGSENSDYEGLCLVLDLRLPEGYPFQPPELHYHPHHLSWNLLSSKLEPGVLEISSNMKLNPNLNNDGSICLSLLNTHKSSSKKTIGLENWSSEFETANIWRVLLSISGLILGTECPWMNEDGWWIDSSYKPILDTDNPKQGLDMEMKLRIQSHRERVRFVTLLHIDWILNGFLTFDTVDSYPNRLKWIRTLLGEDLSAPVFKYYQKNLKRILALQEQYQVPDILKSAKASVIKRCKNVQFD